MADLTITASQVAAGSGASLATKTAAVALTAGDVVYKNASDQWALAQCDGTAEEAAAVGIAVNDGAAGQPVTAVTTGPITLGAGAAPADAQIYCVSATAGGIAPYADLVSTNRVTILGYGIGSNQIRVNIITTGRQKP